MPPDSHRFIPSDARVYVRPEDGRQVEFNLDHVTEIHIDHGSDNDYMATAFGRFAEVSQEISLTLKGLQLGIAKLTTPDGEARDVSYEDWERMILNGIHNEDK